MGFLRKESNSNFQGETSHLAYAPVQQTIGATIAANASPDQNQDTKKRKRNDKSLITSPTPSFNEISDDSDASSDEEKSSQEPPSSDSKQRHLRPATKKRKEGRRVFFGDLFSTTKYHAASLNKTEVRDLKKDLWFTKQDRLRSQAECLEVIKAFRIENAKDVMRFSNVYRTSMQVPFSQESSDYLEQATVSIPLTIRGMEWGIAPKLKKRRKEHIRSVLSLQRNISNAELRERYVSNRSLQSSRPARIIARMIGEGDASASKLGITSTALNITTVPMAETMRKTTTETTSMGKKLSLLEQRRHHRADKKISSCTGLENEISSGRVKTSEPKKMGRPKRRRRPILWRKVA